MNVLDVDEVFGLQVVETSLHPENRKMEKLGRTRTIFTSKYIF